ncbi:hypothetical protein F4861DRAFT_537190 [Xylaria intraflava]|nr:hypothetical protein F4861DRAFT_537190 [Xylaria intraflava]
MATSYANFTGNWMTAKADPAVNYLDFQFDGGRAIFNNQTTSTPVSGTTNKVQVHYNNETWPVGTYTLQRPTSVSFAEGHEVQITGGTHGQATVHVTDANGTPCAVFYLVGFHQSVTSE